MITKFAIRKVFWLLVALAVILAYLAAILVTRAGAQGPATVDDLIPGGIVYALDGETPLDAATVEAWRAVPVVAEARADYTQDTWVDVGGASWGVQWTRAYPIMLDGGGRAVLVIGATRDPALAAVTVAYEARAEVLPDGRIAWHCLRAVIVAREAFDEAGGM